jgi:hypothetical protein
MGPMKRNGTSRGLALYRLLVELYPPRYLRQHRAEMLQNFEDLQQQSPSKHVLWMFIARDLLVSLTEEHMKSLNSLTAYVISVLLVWALIFGIGYFRHGSTPGYPVLHVFGGFLLGMLAMYIATRVYPSSGATPRHPKTGEQR